MHLTQIIVLSVVQGITEFLPISSQAHLILVPRLTGWCDQGLTMDIAVHVGTLAAVVVFFWRECLAMGRGALNLLRGRVTAEGRLFLLIVLATLPVLAAGYVVKQTMGTDLRSLKVIAWATLGWGLALWFADRWGLRVRRVEHMTWDTALIIGVFQAFALVPGTSRSGVTMIAARLLGFERTDAARFSMLLAIPVILAAGTLAGLDIAHAGNLHLTRTALLAAGITFVCALVAIALLLGWLRRATFTPFVVYRVVLGLALLGAVYLYGMGGAAPVPACPV